MTIEQNKIISEENFSLPSFEKIEDLSNIGDKLGNLGNSVTGNLDLIYSQNLKKIFGEYIKIDPRFNEQNDKIADIFANFLNPQEIKTA